MTIEQILAAREAKKVSERRKNGRLIIRVKCAGGHIWDADKGNLLQGHWCPNCAIERRTKHRREKTFELARKAAAARGGTVLSKSYDAARAKIRLRCALGHEWSAIPFSITKGRWCPECGREAASRKLRRDIREFRAIAQKKRGRCLTDSHANGRTALKFECHLGHRWASSAASIVSGSWCPECAKSLRGKTRRSRTPISVLQKTAAERGGRCLSASYLGATSKHEWQCGKGHLWQATWYSVKAGTWCDVCANEIRRGRFPRMKEQHLRRRLRTKGIQWLSGNYKNQASKIEVQCENGHRWFARAGSLYHRTGCAQCYGNIRNNLDSVKQFAAERQGKCLSISYENAHCDLKWECALGHKWIAPYDRVRSGSWCPECGSGFGERVCRAYFEHVFRAPFPRCRKLKWLTNDQGNRMELDGYNAELRIAFEHHGKYHFDMTGYYSKNSKELKQRQYLDRLKRKLCKSQGVRLFVIPEIPSLTSLRELPKVIGHQARKLRVTLPLADLASWTPAIAYVPDTFLRLRALCAENGGAVLSSSWLGGRSKMTFRCNLGHTWASTAYSILAGTWCPVCANGRRGKRGVKSPVPAKHKSMHEE